MRIIRFVDARCHLMCFNYFSDRFQVRYAIRNELHIAEQRSDHAAKSFQKSVEMLDVDHDWSGYGHFYL